MNYLKRAMLYLTHKKGQSLLLLLIMSAILVFVLSGLIIQNAAVSATNSVTKSAGTTISVSANRNKMFSKMRSGTSKSKPKTITTPTVSNEKIKKAGKLNTVAYYNITNTASVNASSFDTVSTSTGTSGGGMGMKGGASAGDISIDGVSSTKLTSAFVSKTNKIVSGRNITTSDVNTKNVVIEKELATQNGIKVGDSMTVKMTSSGKKSLKLKVVGIYKAKSTSSSVPGSDPSNTIYTSYTLPATITGTEGKSSTVTYILENSAKEKATTKKIKRIINNSSFSVSSDDASYKQLLQPMKNVQSFAKKIVWLVAIAGTIILALIIILSVRTRQREIGVLVSLGESKFHIVAQLFSELFVILIGAMVVALLLGSFVGNKVGNQLLSQQQTTSVSTTSGSNGGPGGSGAPGSSQTGGGMRGGMATQSAGTTSAANKKTLKTLNTSITPSSVIKLGGMGLVIITLAVCVSAISILRLRPKDILIGE
ncbi:peptide ABC transporter permease [Pediococcus damnosus]|uniref:ABC transporter permease n=1 Tax=Pediococcus damnosus TaxID=51663 RepID=UPI000C1CB564|nr:ABC transporter permease [Pediococcus damnosus]PIO81167.1 peptide ABC transporter permease [Pediococcus damnosus]